MKGTYRIADKIIEIDSIYKDVHDYCRDYVYVGKPDIIIKTTETDIESDRQKAEKFAVAKGLPLIKWPDAYLEEVFIYRSIAEKMPEYDTFMFHASAVAVDGAAYLFTANSGTGKSTHTRLWREYLGERAVMINDDRPLIKVRNDGITVFGTPCNGKHKIGNNIAVPLKAICILGRAEENTIQRVTKSEAYTMLFKQSYHPEDSAALEKTKTLIDKLTDRVSLWRLGCNMDISAAELAYNAMKD